MEYFHFGHFCDLLGIPNQKIQGPNRGKNFFVFHRFFDTVQPLKTRPIVFMKNLCVQNFLRILSTGLLP